MTKSDAVLVVSDSTTLISSGLCRPSLPSADRPAIVVPPDGVPQSLGMPSKRHSAKIKAIGSCAYCGNGKENTTGKFCGMICQQAARADGRKSPKTTSSDNVMESGSTTGMSTPYHTPRLNLKRFRPFDETDLDDDPRATPKRHRDKEATNLIAELKAAKELITVQDVRITELEAELTAAKLAFAEATIKQFSSQQNVPHATSSPRPDQTSYARVASGQAVPTLIAKLAAPLRENSKMSLEEMEQILDTNTGGPIPASVRQKDNTVYLRLSTPADLARATSTLQSRQGPSNLNLFSSVSQTTRLYPVVALFVDLAPHETT